MDDKLKRNYLSKKKKNMKQKKSVQIKKPRELISEVLMS